jgi:hypothetical protein
LRRYGHAEKIQNQRMPKQIAAATMTGIRKRESPDDVEEDLQATARDRLKIRKCLLEAKVHNGL